MEKNKTIENEFNVKRDDGYLLKGTSFIADEEKARMIIVHGMVEHRKRYAAFAKYLNKQNISVYTYDQRGHGESIIEKQTPGFLKDENGWDALIYDLKKVVESVKKSCKVPLILFGHSMGSFVVRTFIALNSDLVDGAIICGTSGMSSIVPSFGEKIAKSFVKKHGVYEVSPFIEKLAFGGYNKKIKPLRTASDWLSTNEKAVDKYIADKLCGFPCPASFYRDLFTGLAFINKKSGYKLSNKNLPIFLIAGEEDPVGNYGKGVKKVYKKYKSAGVKNIQIKLYETGRHEILNELFYSEVFSDVASWVKGIKKE